MKKFLPLIVIGGVAAAAYLSLNAFLPARLNGLRVAACPTFHDELEILEDAGIITTYTNSTGESIRLLSNERVDLVFSGRRLRPEEPEFDHINFDEGYSFIGDNKFSINLSDITEFPFHTDLDKDTVLEDFPWIEEENLREVDDPYLHLSTSIGITSFENTDYSRAEPVSVINWNGKRIRKSRVPTLYFNSEDRKEAKEVISLIGK